MFRILLLGVLARWAWFRSVDLRSFENEPELTTPVVSYMRVREALFVMECPAAGGGLATEASSRAGNLGTVFARRENNLTHLPPIVVGVFFGLLSNTSGGPRELAYWALLLAVDLAIYWALIQIAEFKLSVRGKRGQFLSPAAVGLTYFLNPWVMAGHAALSCQNLHILALLLTIVAASWGTIAGCSLAFAWAL